MLPLVSVCEIQLFDYIHRYLPINRMHSTFGLKD